MAEGKKSGSKKRRGGRKPRAKKTPEKPEVEVLDTKADFADDDSKSEVMVGEIIDVGDDEDDEDFPRELTSVLGTDEHHKLVKRDPLSAYVQETKRYPLLTRAQEKKLAIRWSEHEDADAARKLIESNLRLVVKIAYEYRRAHANLLDLVQEGNIGLMKAVKKYDPYRGVKLSSYAAWWIRAYILKFILNNWRLVKIGTTQAQRKLFFNLKKEKARLEQEGFAPEPALIAERLQVREKDVIEMEKRLSGPDASFDAPVGSGEGEAVRTRHDFTASDEEGRPDVQVEKSQFHELLKEKLETFADTLEGREETIFRERWLTESPLTLQKIGDLYGVSRERARQIEKRMLIRLRHYLEEELGSAVDIDALSRE